MTRRVFRAPSSNTYLTRSHPVPRTMKNETGRDGGLDVAVREREWEGEEE